MSAAPQPSLLWSFNGSMTDSIQGLTFSPAQSYSPALYGQGAAFSNVTGAYINSVSLNSSISTSPGLTLSLWIKPLTSGMTGQIYFIRLFSVVTNPANGNQLEYGFIFQPSQNIDFVLNDPGSNFRQIRVVANYVLNQWYHICAVANNLTLYFYANGRLVTTTAYNLETIGSNAYTSFQLLNYNTPNGAQFTLSDARVYNTTLTDAQVLGIYNSQGIPPSGTLQQVSAPQPNLLWSFNGSNVDSITGASPGFSTVTSGTTSILPSYVSGLYGQAIYFNNQNTSLAGGAVPSAPSANSYIYYGTGAASTSGPQLFYSNSCSISLWISPQWASQSAVTGNRQYILGFPSWIQYWMYMDNVVSGQPFSMSTNTNIQIRSSLPYVQYAWSHHCVTLSNVGQLSGNLTMSYYTNGSFQGSATVSIGVFSDGRSYMCDTLVVGAGWYNGPGPGGMWMAAQDLRIYNTALTATQVLGIYQSQGIPPSGTLQQISAPQPSLLWSFNGSMTDSIQGLTFSPAQSYSPALYGQGAAFSNVTGAYDSSVSLNSPLSTSPGLTLSTWFNGSLPYTNTNNTIFFRLNGTSSGFGPILIRYLGETGIVRLSYYDPVTGFSGTDFIKPYVLNQWYHICFVANNFKFYIYLNGKQVATQNYNTETTGSNAYTSIQLINNGGTSGTSFTLSDTRIYNTALTATQVLGIYNSQGIPPRASLP